MCSARACPGSLKMCDVWLLNSNAVKQSCQASCEFLISAAHFSQLQVFAAFDLFVPYVSMIPVIIKFVLIAAWPEGILGHLSSRV